jgi:hypothetical protein
MRRNREVTSRRPIARQAGEHRCAPRRKSRLIAAARRFSMVVQDIDIAL